MTLPHLTVGVGVGVHLQGGDLKEVAFWSGATWIIAQTLVHPVQTTSAIASSANYVWSTPPKVMAADIVGSRAVQTGAGAALGYTAGAVAATTITSQAEKKGLVYEGATQDLLGFYGFDAGGMEPHYWDKGDRATYGYFNIPGNLKYIGQHYWKKAWS